MARGRALLNETWWSELCLRADESPDAIAIHAEGDEWQESLTFAEWKAMTIRVSTGLSRLGVGKEDRVAVLCPGSCIWPVIQTACSHLGAVLVPINSRYRTDELEHVLRVSKPKVVIYVDRIAGSNIRSRLNTAAEAAHLDDLYWVNIATPPLARNEPAHSTNSELELSFGDLVQSPEEKKAARNVPRSEDPVLLQFTSGTTAFPKAAVLSSGSTLRATYELGQRMGLTNQDVMYSTQPMYHVGGSVATTLMALTIGCTMIVPERYTPELTFELIRKHRATARTGQAAMYAMELAHDDFSTDIFESTTKGWAGGTAELKGSVIERMGITHLVGMYGLTEASASTTVCSWTDDLTTRLESCGSALPDVELGILTDGSIKSTYPTTVGEICVRGWPVMSGYYRDQEATDGAVDSLGWLHTGDIGWVDDTGLLYFVDRLKDMIKPGGENVSSAEVERVLNSIPGVSQSAVVGMVDARLGEVPVAFLERLPGSRLNENEVIAYCQERIASFKVPTSVIFVTDWPMTESGKIVKADLRRMLGTGDPSLVGKSG